MWSTQVAEAASIALQSVIRPCGGTLDHQCQWRYTPSVRCHGMSDSRGALIGRAPRMARAAGCVRPCDGAMAWSGIRESMRHCFTLIALLTLPVRVSAKASAIALLTMDACSGPGHPAAGLVRHGAITKEHAARKSPPVTSFPPARLTYAAARPQSMLSCPSHRPRNIGNILCLPLAFSLVPPRRNTAPTEHRPAISL